MVLVLGLFGAAEAVLRLGGFGYPTAFWLERDGTLVSNARFGWSAFPPNLAREPVGQQLATPKPAGVRRVVVLGGSAALGTPDADFGLAHQLGVMLEGAWPGERIEVVNAAMAAVGSTVVRQIAAELPRIEPDVVVVYLGNNEIVGPFGPGSVFGRAADWIDPQLRLASRRLRLVQVGETWWRDRERPDQQRWRGMEMFLEGGVPPGDPRLEHVAARLRENLEAVIASARRTGARVAVGTVAVDLLDTPPFSSVEPTAAGFAEELERAREAIQAGRLDDAAARLATAMDLEPTHALTTWLAGRVALARGEVAAAREHLARARDLDLLRFRASGDVNRVIREVASATGVSLADVASALDAAPEVSRGIAGNELFWEHVHFTPIGTYRVAQVFREALGFTDEPPTPERVFERLGLTAWDIGRMARDIAAITARPPFTGADQAAERQLVRDRQVMVARVTAREQRPSDRARLEQAESQGGVRERRRLAQFLCSQGEAAAGVALWQQVASMEPEIDTHLGELSACQQSAGEWPTAISSATQLVARRPWSAMARSVLGDAKAGAGDSSGAMDEYLAALAIDPWFEPAVVNLAGVEAQTAGRERAIARLQEWVARDRGAAAVWTRLALVLEEQGDEAAALAAYDAAIAADPRQVVALNNRGGILERRGEHQQAFESYGAAVAADPLYPRARFNLADLFFAFGQLEQAAEQYRIGLGLDPGNAQARRNLEEVEGRAAGQVE